jgi:exosortase A
LDQKLNLAGDTNPAPASPERRLLLSLGFLLTAILVVTGLAWQSVLDMVSVWWNHSAYNHGLFIIPIAAYMAWQRRERIAGLTLEPFWPGLVVVGVFAMAWLLARGASIMEGEQLAYVGIVQGLMLTILGRRIFRAQILPILYLWLMVPTGSFLLYSLQVISSWLTAFFLSFTSIPFYVEEFYFQLPVGLFVVAPGCAGLNFLFAALALSIVYADLMYVGWQRKIICILTWLGVAVLANGVRIFGILVIAELTDMKLAIVDDHLLYGWGFFFIILIGLMMAGQRFSNMPPHKALTSHLEWMPAAAARPATIATAALASVLIAASIIGYGQLAFSNGTPMTGLTITVPGSPGEWSLASDPVLPERSFANADIRRIWQFDSAAAGVNLSAAFYAAQWDGHEAVADNHLLLADRAIKIIGRASPTPVMNGVPRRVIEETVTTGRGGLLVWRWYCVGSNFTARDIEVRMRTALARLLMRDNAVTVFTLLTQDGAPARGQLTSLMQAISRTGPGVMLADAQGKSTRNLVCW